MIYTINRKTKEHRVYEGGGRLAMAPEWRLVDADADGWIPWNPTVGAESPISDHQKVEIKLKDGEVVDEVSCWDDQPFFHRRVAAYRPVLSETSKPEPPTWGGEDLPPVGCECDCYHTGTYQGVVTVRYMGSEMCVLLNHDHGEEQCGPIDAYSFRPIRSEEEDAKHEMARVIASALGTASPEWWDASKAIFQAIRDGEIPGVKLTGGER